MEGNTGIIIIGPKESGKTTLSNRILHGSTSNSLMSYDKNSFHVTSGSFHSSDVVVLDASCDINRKLFDQMVETATVLANSFVILVVVKAAEFRHLPEMIELITGKESCACLIITDKDHYNISELDKYKDRCMLGTLEVKTPASWDTELTSLHAILTGRNHFPSGSDKLLSYSKSVDKRNKLYIVVMGAPGSGKSTTANVILGEQKFKTELYKSKPTTQIHEETVKATCRNHLQMETVVVDTPTELDGNTITRVRFFIFERRPLHTVFLITQNISSRMTLEEQGRITVLEQSLGREFLKRQAGIVFTHGDEFNVILKQGKYRSFEEWLQSQGHTALSHLISLCNNRSVLVNNMEVTSPAEQNNAANIWKMIHEIEEGL